MTGSSELQAVVLAAGRGCRMTELTVGRPKCLLPVGQYPLIYHTLRLLERFGFKDALVVVQHSALGQIQSALSRCDLSLTPELVAIVTDEDSGTADSIRYLYAQEKLKSDALVITCDLITTNGLDQLVQVFRQHRASIASLFFSPNDKALIDDQPPGDKSKARPEKDIAVINVDTRRLALIASASDFEDGVPFKLSMLRQHSKLSLRTDLMDAHAYVMSLAVIEFLANSPSFSAIKGEFVPFIVGKQHCYGLNGEKKSSAQNGMCDPRINLSSYNDHYGDLKPAYHGDAFRCYAVIASPEHIGIRVNSIPSFWLSNRLMIGGVGELDGGQRVDPSADVQTTQIADSFIGANCVIKEKTSIRESVLGDSCTLETKSRLSKCIILRAVEIGSGCVLENCIVGADVRIGSDCELKNCVIGSSQEIGKGTKASFQVLTHADRLMEI